MQRPPHHEDASKTRRVGFGVLVLAVLATLFGTFPAVHAEERGEERGEDVDRGEDRGERGEDRRGAIESPKSTGSIGADADGDDEDEDE